MLRMLDLFSGIAGFSLAARWTNSIQTVAFCERDKFCQKVIRKNFGQDVIIHDTIEGLDGSQYRGTIDIICGGAPCQPFSVAGKQRGKTDSRYLWPEMFRVIKESKSTWVCFENVIGIVNLALDTVLTDLECEDYETQSFIIPAAGVSAPHKRERVWVVAHSKSSNGDQEWQSQSPQIQSGRGTGWLPEPSVLRVVDGIPTKLDRNRLKGLGNAIVPQIAFQILNGIVKIENV